jgi:hypothetical protein
MQEVMPRGPCCQWWCRPGATTVACTRCLAAAAAAAAAAATGTGGGSGGGGPAPAGATHTSSSSLYYSLTCGTPAPLAPPSQLCLVCIPDRGSRTASVLNTYDISSSGGGGASSSATLVYPDRFTHNGLYSVSGEQLELRLLFLVLTLRVCSPPLQAKTPTHTVGWCGPTCDPPRQ